MTRAEIGNYLGMTLETVSRALSKLARDEVIEFAEKGRRDIRIPDVDALSAFVQRCLAPGTRRCSRTRSSGGADDARDRLRQLLARARLPEQFPAERRVAIGFDQLGREARHEDDRQPRDALLRLRREFGAAHAGAERDVAEEQVEAGSPSSSASSACSPLGASSTLQREAVEEAAHDGAHFGIVFDQQHREPLGNGAFGAGVADCAAQARRAAGM